MPFLQTLLDVAPPVAVITQPDRPAGRGQEDAAPAVKRCALAAGLPVWQPTSLRDARWHEAFASLALDLAIVVAFGRILPPGTLATPRLGCVNAHASLLPRWRGAAPIAAAIAAEDSETGVCLMQMEAGLDTGPLLAQARTAIGEHETAGELTLRLATLGAELLRRSLPALLAGELTPVPQPSVGITLAAKLSKEAGSIDWRRPAAQLAAQVRAMSPWPGAYTMYGEQRLILHRCQAVTLPETTALPGTVLQATAQAWHVACGQGVLALEEVQKPGKRRMSASEFLAGNRDRASGLRFGSA